MIGSQLPEVAAFQYSCHILSWLIIVPADFRLHFLALSTLVEELQGDLAASWVAYLVDVSVLLALT